MSLDTLVSALSLGGLYAMLALGVALIFGILQLINFAHGELIMVGGYTVFLVSLPSGLAIVGATLAAVVGVALAMERVAFRPVRGADPATLLVTSFAVSFMLQNLAIMIFGARAKTVNAFDALDDPIDVVGLDTTLLDLVTLGVTAVVLVALALFLARTDMGVQMRAAAEDFQMARLLGVHTNRVIAVAFAISGILAGAVSLLLVTQSGTVNPTMGLVPVLIAFVATVVGGLGRLQGAVLGGFLLGFVTVGLQTFLPEGLRPYRDAFVFGAVILLLAARPHGLVPSSAMTERV